MRVVLQRVREASVAVDGRVVGRVGRGLLLLVAFTEGDGEESLEWMARKLIGIRVFEDDDGRMNRSVEEIDGGVLVVSQFTLYGDARKGRRPSFTRAAAPAIAVPLYERFLELLEVYLPGAVQSGDFGAMMEISLVNEGPVTLVIDRDATPEPRPEAVDS